MIVLYSFAHSDPSRGPGASTRSGYRERTVALKAFPSFKREIEQAGHQLEIFSGPLQPVIRLMLKKIDKARAREQKHVAVELHFNNPPWIECPNCMVPRMQWIDGAREIVMQPKKIRAGLKCNTCGQVAVHWRYGHTAMIYRHSTASLMLADAVLSSLSKLMPWSRKRRPILMPDSRYGKKDWPERIIAPAILVEAGFGVDRKFSDFISVTDNQLALGSAVGEGVLSFIDKASGVSLADWSK